MPECGISVAAGIGGERMVSQSGVVATTQTEIAGINAHECVATNTARCLIIVDEPTSIFKYDTKRCVGRRWQREARVQAQIPVRLAHRQKRCRAILYVECAAGTKHVVNTTALTKEWNCQHDNHCRCKEQSTCECFHNPSAKLNVESRCIRTSFHLQRNSRCASFHQNEFPLHLLAIEVRRDSSSFFSSAF